MRTLTRVFGNRVQHNTHTTAVVNFKLLLSNVEGLVRKQRPNRVSKPLQRVYNIPSIISQLHSPEEMQAPLELFNIKL